MPNPTEPSGGFQHGSWYEGRQYDATTKTFGAPNQIIVGSSAGQMVSPEVQKQSSLLQVPTNPNAVQDYFNNYQKMIQDKLKGKDIAGGDTTSVLGEAINSSRPTPPDLTATYTSLADQYGVSNLQKNINDLTAKKRAIQQSVVSAAGDTEAQPGVTADVVAGRESEQQRQADKQIASVDLEIQTATDQLNAANGTIQMIMGFTQQDYQNASQAYDTEFSQSIQYQELLNSEASTQQKLAMGNWQTITNLITSGVIDPNKMTPEQQAQVKTWETAAGLPSGITSLIQNNTDAGDKVVHFDANTGQTVIQKKNGEITTLNASQTGFQTNPVQSFMNWVGGLFGGGSSQQTSDGYTIETVK